jgi:hypothetical protein
MGVNDLGVDAERLFLAEGVSKLEIARFSGSRYRAFWWVDFRARRRSRTF